MVADRTCGCEHRDEKRLAAYEALSDVACDSPLQRGYDI
jgi:hypothetical protein